MATSAFDPNDIFNFNNLGVGRTSPNNVNTSAPSFNFGGASNNSLNSNFNFPDINLENDLTAGQFSGINDSKIAENGENGFNFFGKDGVLIPGLNALGGLIDAGTAIKTLRAQKDAFEFNKKLATTELANSAQITNASITDHARTSGRQSGLTGNALDNFIADRVAERRVSGTI